MDAVDKLLVLLLVAAIFFYPLRWWWRGLGRQTVGKIPVRMNTVGKYAMRSRIMVYRRVVTADIPEVEVHLGMQTVLTLSVDEARRMADQVEEAARLAAEGA